MVSVCYAFHFRGGSQDLGMVDPRGLKSAEAHVPQIHRLRSQQLGDQTRPKTKPLARLGAPVLVRQAEQEAGLCPSAPRGDAQLGGCSVLLSRSESLSARIDRRSEQSCTRRSSTDSQRLVEVASRTSLAAPFLALVLARTRSRLCGAHLSCQCAASTMCFAPADVLCDVHSASCSSYGQTT